MPEESDVAVLQAAKGQFSSVCTEFELGARSWLTRHGDVARALRFSEHAGEDTVAAADAWLPRPVLLREVKSLIVDGEALVTQLGALQKPGATIVEGTTQLDAHAQASVATLPQWSASVAALQRRVDPARALTTHVTTSAGHVDQAATDYRDAGIEGARYMEVLGMRAAVIDTTHTTTKGAGEVDAVAADADATAKIIDGLRESGAALAEHSSAITHHVSSATTAIDESAGVARSLVGQQEKAATHVAATNAEARRLGDPKATTSARSRLADLEQLRRTLAPVRPLMEGLLAQFVARRQAIAAAFDAAIARAQQAAEGAT